MFTNPLKRVIVLAFLQSAKFFRTTGLPLFFHLAGRVNYSGGTVQKSRSASPLYGSGLDPSCHFDTDPDPAHSFQIKAQNLEEMLK
jgi:hypothetical protein